jgi:hypothetical protein
MTSKTTKKAATGKQAAKASSGKTTTKPKATPTADEAATVTKATTPTTPADEGPAGQKPTEPTPPAAPRDEAQPEPDDSAEVVVFAFRLTRAERDTIHAAAGSARASKFVRAVALAAARRDTTALQAAIQEAETNRAK